MNEYMGTKEALAATGLSRETFELFMKNGHGPKASKIGGKRNSAWVFLRADVEEWVSKRGDGEKYSDILIREAGGLTSKEAAKRLGISPQWLAGMKSYGVGPVYHRLTPQGRMAKNGRVYYLPADLDTWLSDTKKNMTPEEVAFRAIDRAVMSAEQGKARVDLAKRIAARCAQIIETECVG